MKEVAKLGGNNALKLKDIFISVIQHSVIAVLSFISSRADVLGTMLPFGLSFMAGCPSVFMPSAAIGVFAGYFFPAIGNGGFKYIAAMLAILAIRLMVSAYKKISQNPIFLSFICLLSNALTSAVTLSGLPSSLMRLICETLLAAAGAYFISVTSRAISRDNAGLSGDELACMLISISILLMGISDVGFLGISLGRTLGILLIMISAKYGGILSGAIAGISVSFASALSGTDLSVCIAFTLGGLMAGVFSTLGRYAQIAAFATSLLIGTGIDGFDFFLGILFIELLFASSVFSILPRSIGIVLGKLFSAYPKISVPTGAKKALTMRLSMAAAALNDVSQTVEQVSQELSRINAPDFSGVITAVEQDACSGCKLRLHCWEAKKEATTSAVLSFTAAVKNGESDICSAAPEEFKGRCIRTAAVANAVYKNYSDYAAKIAAENRIDEVRSVVSDQFDGISDMLLDMAEDFENAERFDSAMALKAAGALKNINIIVLEANSKIDRYGRMTIELKLKKSNDTVLNKMHIMKTVSLACERDFDVPSFNEIGSDIFITLSEKATYKIDIGVYQQSAEHSNMCGDSYNYFTDGKGHFIMVLSDGMGTGGRAAVDGAMASGLMSRLLKAGFGYDCSLRILNSSMLFKSTDESLATVDIASIDLFTGMTELYKAGAAPTIVRRSGRTGKAESTSLPIGILREIGFDRAGVKMKDGDIVLIMSDGATGEGIEWIRNELEDFSDGTAQNLAEHICMCAARRRSDNHEDDITVMAAIIEKAV